MPKTLSCPPVLLSVLAVLFIVVFAPQLAHAQQEPSTTLNLSLTYSTNYDNRLPTPLTVTPGSACSLQSVSFHESDDPIKQKLVYYSSATVTAPFLVRLDGGIDFNCEVKFDSARTEFAIFDIAYVPSLSEIQADMQAFPGPVVFNVEIAYLLYVDASIPGHYIYHFRGNDSLFALAQQTFGVNFTGVELLLDV